MPSYTDLLRVAFTSKFFRGKLSDLVSLLSGRDFETREYKDEIAQKSFELLHKGVLSFVNETNFKRYIMINGKEHEITTTSHFSFTEAKTAGLFEKDNYKKYARIMIGVRAFTLGAREIADDVIMGVMETSELKLITDTPLDGSEFIDAEIIN